VFKFKKKCLIAAVVGSMALQLWSRRAGACSAGIRLFSATFFRSRASSSVAEKLVDKVDAFVFDCDGVIWKGETALPGARETLKELRRLGKKVFFITNNATRSRLGNKEKFDRLDIDVDVREVLCSSYAAALYLRSINFPDSRKKVYVIGGSGIGEELDLIGVRHIGGPDDAGKEIIQGEDIKIDHNVGAVVVGFDPKINYYKLQYAQLCLNESSECLFVATNEDAVGHFTPQQEWAGAGAMVGAIKGCTGRQPIVVGKPSPLLLIHLLKANELESTRMCMVGDRLDTDILFGKSNGLLTCLTLTGVTSRAHLESGRIPSDRYPEYIVNSIEDILCS
jgi:phosphoglycolate/pyridoxal phosphate phosphatase family enzyme